MGPAVFPSLVKHLGDDRYSYSGVSAAWLNFRVSDAIVEILDDGHYMHSGYKARQTPSGSRRSVSFSFDGYLDGSRPESWAEWAKSKTRMDIQMGFIDWCVEKENERGFVDDAQRGRSLEITKPPDSAYRRSIPNQTVQRTGASRFAQRQIERHRRLAPVADLCVRQHLDAMRIQFTAPLVVLLGPLFGCSHQGGGGYRSVEIHAIRATGESWSKPPQPIWSFVITNAGSLPAYWESGVEEKGGYDTNYNHAGGLVDWPEGTLAPGCSVETNMIVPGATGRSWRARVDYGRDVRETRNRYHDDWHSTAEPFGLHGCGDERQLTYRTLADEAFPAILRVVLSIVAPHGPRGRLRPLSTPVG